MNSENEIKATLSRLIKERDAQVKQNLEFNKQQGERIRTRQESYLKNVTSILKDQKIDIAPILRVDERKGEEALEDTEKIREVLVNSKRGDYNHLGQTETDMFSIILAFPYLTPYYSKQYASDGTVHAEGYGIEDLDPWVKSTGSGSGWGGAEDFQVTIDRWFVFTPRNAGTYSMSALQPFNGFYIVKADDGLFTSKEARAIISNTIQAYQYFWHAPSNFRLFFLEDDNIDTYGRVDIVYSRPCRAFFTGGDPAFVLVTQRLICYARGSGSYAELNFSDGEANVLHAPYLIGFDVPV